MLANVINADVKNALADVQWVKGLAPSFADAQLAAA